MKWILGISLLVLSIMPVAYGQDAGADANLQAQLQRLQQAVQQARQASPERGSTFQPPPGQLMTLPNLQGQQPTIQGAPPPVLPGTIQPAVPGEEQEADGAPTASPLIGLGTGPTLHEQAFSGLTDALLPLSPDQVRTLHSLFSQTQRAAGEHPGIPPRPTSSSKIVNLAPGATPPIIRLAAGFVTSLVFLDATGAPWPVEAYDLGDPRAFNIQWDKKGNTLMVQAITEYKTGNLAVMLKGMDTPIMLTMLPGQRAVDYRVDLRVPGLGPNATPSISVSLPNPSNPLLLDVLNGIPPQGSKALQVVGRDCQVWVVNGRMYVRTRLTVLSPAWLGTLSSADGMHAYEMEPTPVILASENGKMVKLAVQGF